MSVKKFTGKFNKIILINNLKFKKYFINEN